MLSQGIAKNSSNCLRVVNNLEKPKYFGDYCMILQGIQEKKLEFEGCELIHEHRTSNRDAHRIARMATSLEIGRFL